MTLYPEDHSIIFHTIKIGWRNTEGRANPVTPGKLIAHLLVPESLDGKVPGANFIIAYEMTQELEAKGVKGFMEIRSDHEKRAIALAKRYVEIMKDTSID